MKNYPLRISVLLLLLFLLVACGAKPNATQNPVEETNVSSQPLENFQVLISGGYDLNPIDNGRPVILIASALSVPEEVFREAFSHVHPAGAGEQPSSAQVKENKAALMNVLETYGVTNDRLDEVSNYYRYNRSAGETWPQVPATVEAVVEDGVVTGFKIINPGFGYSSPPVIAVVGSDVSATITLLFSTDFTTNGSISEIVIAQ